MTTIAAGRPSRDFRVFRAAAATSNLGDGIRLAAFPLLALELTDDARLIAGVTAMSFLPWILVGPFSGVLVDRRDRRTLMLVGQLVRSVAVATLAVSVSGGRASVGLLYLVSIAVAAGETVVDSASQAAVPHLVDDEFLKRANGQITVAENLFNHVIGIGLGAMLYSLNPSVPFYGNAMTIVASAALLTRVRRPLQRTRTDTATASVWADTSEGLRFLLGDRFLCPLALSVATTNLAVNIGFGVMVVLVIDEIGSTESVFGLILAIGSLGGVLGASVAGYLVTRLTPQRTLKMTHLPFVVAAIIFTTATSAWMVSLAFVLSSFAVVLFQIPSRSMRQRVTPDHLLGRVVAAFRLFGLGGPVAGAPLGGVITQTPRRPMGLCRERRCPAPRMGARRAQRQQLRRQATHHRRRPVTERDRTRCSSASRPTFDIGRPGPFPLSD